MTEVQIRSNPFIATGGFSSLIQDLWGGKISENDFVGTAHQQGVSVARIEWELEQLKMTDEVL